LANVNALHKAFAAKDLVVQVRSEFWVSRLFWCRKSKTNFIALS